MLKYIVICLMFVGTVSPNDNNSVKHDKIGTVSCVKHSIYCQIVRNRPKINRPYAMELSNLIYKASKRHKFSARIFTAILAQESMYRLDARNSFTGYDEEGLKRTIYLDFGVGQITVRTIESHKFDVHRLTTDLEYSVNAAAKVFSYFSKRYSKKEKDWWVRYHCGTSSIRSKTCGIYRQLVTPYM